MISVVICSINKDFAAQIKRNIDETIGVPWELILLDNNELKLGICEVYNRGGELANYPVLCFVHEDVVFKTYDWGKKIIGYFHQDDRLGLIGVAGSKYKSSTFSGWSTGIREFDCCNILHQNKEGKEVRIFSNPVPGTILQDVVTIDGVLMVARKKVWQDCPFNAEQLKGFHLYDLDFSLSVSRKYTVAVVFDVDLVHLTEGGDYGNKWLDATITWHQQKADCLPSASFSLHHFPFKDKENVIRKKWLDRLKSEKISFSRKLTWIKLSRSLDHLSLWPNIVIFILFRQVKTLFS